MLDVLIFVLDDYSSRDNDYIVTIVAFSASRTEQLTPPTPFPRGHHRQEHGHGYLEDVDHFLKNLGRCGRGGEEFTIWVGLGGTQKSIWWC